MSYHSSISYKGGFVSVAMPTKISRVNIRSLLWETLTGREHLLFYGRMKNLTGAALIKVV
jgi:hypothetical protein